MKISGAVTLILKTFESTRRVQKKQFFSLLKVAEQARTSYHRVQLQFFTLCHYFLLWLFSFVERMFQLPFTTESTSHPRISHLAFTIFIIFLRWIDGTRVSFKDRQGKLFRIINAMNENPFSLILSQSRLLKNVSSLIMPSWDAWVRPELQAIFGIIQDWIGNKLPNSFGRFLSVEMAFPLSTWWK